MTNKCKTEVNRYGAGPTAERRVFMKARAIGWPGPDADAIEKMSQYHYYQALEWAADWVYSHRTWGQHKDNVKKGVWSTACRCSICFWWEHFKPEQWKNSANTPITLAEKVLSADEFLEQVESLVNSGGDAESVVNAIRVLVDERIRGKAGEMERQWRTRDAMKVPD